MPLVYLVVESSTRETHLFPLKGHLCTETVDPKKRFGTNQKETGEKGHPAGGPGEEGATHFLGNPFWGFPNFDPRPFGFQSASRGRRFRSTSLGRLLRRRGAEALQLLQGELPLQAGGLVAGVPDEAAPPERWFLFPTNLLGHYSSFRGPFRILAAGQEVPSANFRGTCVSLFASANLPRGIVYKFCFREHWRRNKSHFK